MEKGEEERNKNGPWPLAFGRGKGKCMYLWSSATISPVQDKWNPPNMGGEGTPTFRASCICAPPRRILSSFPFSFHFHSTLPN